MKKISLILLLSTFLITNSFACINGDSKYLKDGTFIYEDVNGNVPYGHNFSSNDQFKNGIIQLDKLYLKTKNLDYLSDKGVLFILLKRYPEAVKLYLEIENLKPNRYSTASNLGTVYELLGENENALLWIKKAVAISPKSHKGSEWIHVKILEAKIKGKEFYNTNFLLNTNFGTELLPSSNLTKSALKDLATALYYQLNERISFVIPEDKIIAQLLFDLGNTTFLLGEFADAIADYKQAKNYGFTEQIIDVRIKECERLLTQPTSTSEKIIEKKVKKSYSKYLIYSIPIFACVALIIFKFKRKNVI